jgi:transcriptional regulator with XRE-family HTH domain
MNPLLRLRMHARLTRKQLAERAGVNYTTINDFERGRSNLQDETRFRLAGALGVEPAELLLEPEPAAPEVAA